MVSNNSQLWLFHIVLTKNYFINSYNEEGIVSLHQGTERLNIQNSVPIWATFGSSVPNVVQEIDGRINTNSYIGFLQTFVYPTAMDQFSNVSPLIVIHDHYPVHTARAVKHWLKKKSNILVLDEWPRNFGDLMPFEKVWRIIAAKINERKIPIASNTQLWNELSIMWSDEVNEEFVSQELKAFPTKLNDVVKNSVDWISE